MDATRITFIDSSFINSNTDFSLLMHELKLAFAANNVEVPSRQHHDFKNTGQQADSTLLLMPAWHGGKDAGVKIVTISPDNGKLALPSIQGTYIYLDAATGAVKAIMDAKALTAKRTAAASALASSFLSKQTASSLLMVGTGALSKNLILAHASVRPIEKVFVWGRNFDKACAVANDLQGAQFSIEAVENIEDVIADVDIISCATLSKTPLVFGKDLVAGQHVDLVGSYRKDMREADDETILKSQIFVDTHYGALHETGDICIPIQNGIISAQCLKADLFELCAGTKPGRVLEEDITVFKSVGHSLEDLIAARYYYDKYMQ